MFRVLFFTQAMVSTLEQLIIESDTHLNHSDEHVFIDQEIVDENSLDDISNIDLK